MNPINEIVKKLSEETFAHPDFGYLLEYHKVMNHLSRLDVILQATESLRKADSPHSQIFAREQYDDAMRDFKEKYQD